MSSIDYGDLSLSEESQDEYLAPFCRAEGAVTSRLFAPPGYSLWMLGARLATGSTLRWGIDHGDEVLYVRSGLVEVGSQRCYSDGAVVVEAGVELSVRAGSEVELYHFGPSEPKERTDGLFGPPAKEGRHVHVLGADGAYALTREGSPVLQFFADSCCQTCRLNLFRVSGSERYRTPSHEHSIDEIITVLAGELRVGRTVVSAGMAIAVPGGLRYGFQTPGGFSFLNYRADASMGTSTPGTAPVAESCRPPGLEF